MNFTMSYEEYDEGFTMPEFHFHNDFEVYILERGNRIVSVDRTEIPTSAGDVMFFAKEEPHKSKGSEGFAGICIHFSERFLKRYFTNAAIDKIMKVFYTRKISLSTDNLHMIKKMTEEFVIDDEYNFLRLAKVFEIFHEGLNNTKSEKVSIGETAFSSKDKKSAHIFTYVNENYAYIKNLKEVSDLFQISESYLFKLFQNEYDMTPKTYINKLKIKNICSCLKYSDRTIKSIAVDYGFESYEHFCRVFKKEMGCTPTEYRKLICQ